MWPFITLLRYFSIVNAYYSFRTFHQDFRPKCFVRISTWMVMLFFSLRKCDPMSKTSEAVIFSARIPFALFDIDMYASKYDRSKVWLDPLSNSRCASEALAWNPDWTFPPSILHTRQPHYKKRSLVSTLRGFCYYWWLAGIPENMGGRAIKW